MDSELIETNKHGEEVLQISFPVDKKNLGDFVSSLLGKKQSLERTYPIDFEIDHDWLINLNECIDQRISQQAESQLVNFNTVIYFENGTKRTISSLESFRHYKETKPLISIGVKITWEYLVNFPKKPHPEKQQISFTAFTSIIESSKQRTILEKLILNEIEYSASFINIQIDHTERTWGDDIETVVNSCVEEAHTKKNSWEIIYKYSRLIIVFIIIFLLMIFPTYFSNYLSSYLIDQSAIIFDELKNKSIDLDSINLKLDNLYQMISGLEQSKNLKLNWLILSTFLAPIVIVIFLYSTKTATKSFILLTTKARQLKSNDNKNYKKKVAIVIFSYLASIVASLIAAFSFNLISGG